MRSHRENPDNPPPHVYPAYAGKPDPAPPTPEPKGITLNKAFKELRRVVKSDRAVTLEFKLRNNGNYPSIGLNKMPDNCGRWQIWDGEQELHFESRSLDGAMNRWREARATNKITDAQVDEIELMISEVQP